MKTIGIFYGSTTGTTATIAEKIAKKLNITDSDVFDVAKTSPSKLGDYDVVIAGTSTWGAGDMQSDWYDFLDGAKVLDLNGRKFAVFGCGDESMSDTFCSGMAELYSDLIKTGAAPIGAFNADGYEFEHSEAVKDGIALGLILDEVNHANIADKKIDQWLAQLKDEI